MDEYDCWNERAFFLIVFEFFEEISDRRGYWIGCRPLNFFFYLRLSLLSLTFRKFKELHFLDEIEVSRLFK